MTRKPQPRAEVWRFNEALAAKVLDAAIDCAMTDGYQWITREQVAAAAGVSPGSVSNAYGTMRDLKRAVLRAAVERGLPAIVLQGLVDNHPIALAAPDHVKDAARAQL